MAAQSEIQSRFPVSPASRCGGHIVVRQLRGSEESACDAFFGQLHWYDVRWRFGGPRTSGGCLLPRREGFCQSLAFAASSEAGDILGIINVEYLDADTAEVALIVRSDLKHQGIGALLLSHVMNWSRTSGLKWLTGHVMTDNKAMLRLALAAGFICVGGDQALVELNWPIDTAA
ncbi:GNAT family N-acetyltransferase [Mesorhizobium qingshengii]|uniref:Acetyltransferase (GNAT) family protein n=1 Tax=Mesorhizobium qingshengii TaxID=1165689 RepID=A0A1G5Z9T4_9HYPH|nr:GNAT family N-acetyltransferase [Mesorhizobium qingshengii]SDA91346.1 Acetyltransferase (GNAT) family protein [Mesorhizobium qingshengii]